ncbi:erythritol ABC transporter membrane protein [Hydrogenispora ethanolica]|uniref:Erythritol ABC transporter membrane protein n=1 Tax=Hydrogenispora ethanolica TaxID=1082276 RepID=A0A4R1R5Q8_HYDET|nr:ABC transporter permease [Hydrogenispora ethanolica]TCL60861.1 erythritol ABC transporter membrane protein [Hydrogenispora ethanolica]
MNAITQPEVKRDSRQKISLGMILLKARTFIALIILTIVFSIVAPNFFSTNNLILVAKHVTLYALLGIGMTFVIVSGGIDLSVGSIVGLTGMFAGGLIYEGLVLPMFGVAIYFNIFMVMLLAVLLGVLVGAVNGILISRFKVAPFIVTLGTMYIARGFALLRSGGETFPNLIGEPELGNTGFPVLGAGNFLGIPISIWILIVIGLIAAYIFKKTPLGWHIFAVGGNQRAAELSGVRVNRVKLFVYMFSGFCSALVGLIVSSQLVASHPATGESWEMNAIAAAVLGGTSMAGGIGTIGGTIVGAFVIGVLNDGMVMIGISEFWQMVIKGLVIILAVIVDQFQRNLQSKLALMNKEA